MIVANASIAVVTIANTLALAWYNKRQTVLGESQTEHEKIMAAEKRVNRRIIFPAFLMLLVSIAGIVISVYVPANDVTTQVLRISGFTGAFVFSIVLILFGYVISLFRAQVTSTKGLFSVVERLITIANKQSNDP
jgi:H+/gluconate symporter-like permease